MFDGEHLPGICEVCEHTFVRIKTHFHSPQVLLSNWNIHHNVQHRHRLRLDTSPRPLSSGLGLDICLDMTKLSKIVAASALNARETAMLAVCMTETLRELPTCVAIASAANPRMLMSPANL